MKGGAAYRIAGVVLALLLTGVAIYLVRPREFGLTYCSAGLFVASVLGTAWFRRPGLRNSFLLLASVSLITGLLDPITYFTHRSIGHAHIDGIWGMRYDSELGTALPPDVVATSRTFVDAHLIYDVTYTTDADGHRMVIGSTDPSADSVSFVGCSFTFGQGLENDETLPQQFSDRTDRKYYVTNFGVPGYGIHEPLRSMELGQLNKILTAGKHYIVYTGIPSHAQRAAATRMHGPSYGLRPDGTIKYLGQTQSAWEYYAAAVANRSLFLRTRVLVPLVSGYSSNAIPLYVALVKRAGEVAREKYQAKFIVIFWDNPGSQLATDITDAFDKAAISYVRVSKIIPDFEHDDQKYRLSRYDQHPNALADRLIAEYLAQHLDDIPPQP